MGIKQSLTEAGLMKAYDILAKNPKKNLLRAAQVAEKLDMGGSFKAQLGAFKEMAAHPENNWNRLLTGLFDEIDEGVLKATYRNFFLNGSLLSGKKAKEMREKYNCNIPWAILLDPTSACNLHCTGCWAAQYGNKLNLSFEDLDSIITQGK